MTLRFSFAIFLFGLVYGYSIPVQADVNIVVDEDAWIKQAASGDNFGSDQELSVKKKSGDSLRAVFKFDLSSVPTNVEITSATVSFRVTTADSQPVNVYRITSDWSEGGVTWGNIGAAYDSSSIRGSFTPSSDDTFVSVDLTDLVKDWVCGVVSNYGLMLIATSSDTESKYVSKEGDTASQRPLLSVQTGASGGCSGGSVIPFAFNCVESGLATLTGNLYTKTVGQSFSIDVVALKDGDGDGVADAVETAYATDADRTVSVELVDTSSAAACSAYPALSPAVSQSLVFTASDAGRKASAAMSTNVAYRSVGCRVTDNTDTANPVVGCSTNSFAARPTAMSVSSNITNSGSSGGPAAKAGANFTMTATATAGYDGVPSLDSGKLEAHAAASQTGVVSGTFGSANPATGIATASNFTYDEVGNFRYLAEGVFDASFTAIDQVDGDCTDDFSNAVVGGKVGCKFGNTSATDYFGRFIPDHFTLSGGFLTNRIDRACAPLSNFTYMDEYFQAVFLLSARNLAGDVTQNYVGAYAKLDPIVPSNFDFTVLNIDAGVTDLTGRLNIRNSMGLWINGIAGNITADLAITRFANPDGAYAALNVGVNPVDSDGVALNSFDLDEDFDTVDDHAAIGQTDLRYGRLNIANAHGSELLILPVPLTAQYYSGSGIGFVTNTDDSCTAIAIGDLTLSNNIETGQTDGDINIQASPNIATQASFANAILIAGDAGLGLCPPGNPVCTPAAGNTGYVDIDVATPSYLQFDWFDTGLANPRARASFGLFKGRGSQIYMREVY